MADAKIIVEALDEGFRLVMGQHYARMVEGQKRWGKNRQPFPVAYNAAFCLSRNTKLLRKLPAIREEYVTGYTEMGIEISEGEGVWCWCQ
jgi:hypothetical protein